MAFAAADKALHVRPRGWMAAFVCALMCIAVGSGRAQSSGVAYPAKAVRLIVAAPPGGGTDQLARLIGERLAARMGQPFVIDNRGGGGGTIAAMAVSKSAPDGYTLLITNSQLTATTAMTTQPTLDPIKDLAPLALVGWQPIVMGVGEKVPAKSIRELVELARANPGKYAFASCGQGTPLHLSGALFNLSAGIELTHVPYRGCGPAMIDVVGGQVPVFFTILGNALPFEKNGQARILGVGSARRLPAYPELPTIAESGFPTFEAFTWFGLLGPAGTPADVLRRLNREINAIVAEAAVAEKMRTLQFEPSTDSTEGFAKMLSDDLQRWARTVRDAKIKTE